MSFLRRIWPRRAGLLPGVLDLARRSDDDPAEGLPEGLHITDKGRSVLAHMDKYGVSFDEALNMVDNEIDQGERE